MSELRKRIKKGWNFIIKSLVNVNRSVTFAPATAIDVHWNTDKPTNLSWKNIFKKDSKKLVRFENGCYICTPQTKFTEHFFKYELSEVKQGKFIERLVRNNREMK